MRRCLFQWSFGLWILVGLTAVCFVAPARLHAQTMLGKNAGEENSSNHLKMRFCWCPRGKLTMGSSKGEKDRFADENQVDVTLSHGFWMGKYEVTQAQYQSVMGKNAGSVKGFALPMENVRWTDAQEFCRKLTKTEKAAGRLPAGWEYRLPSEAQWEYACRAGTTTAYSFGNDPKKLADYGWHRSVKTHLVGQKKPNPWGLYDVHGNVWEWCRDAYQKTLPGGVDPQVTLRTASRVVRGGCWNCSAKYCRSASRYRGASYVRHGSIGFRVALARVPAVVTVARKAGEENSGNQLKMKFCWCPKGKFKMGSPKTEAGRGGHEDQVDVTLSRGFWMGKYEVTQKEYRSVMGRNPSKFEGDSSPVEQVRWNEATAFCQKLTRVERAAGRLPKGWEYRLPSEAQWEYACRAGTTTVFSFGNDVKNLGDYAWYDGNGNTRTHRVGQKKPNAWGLHDMHGNVFEWCRDWHQPKLPGGTDPEVTKQTAVVQRMVRGGSAAHEAASCRSACPNSLKPDLQSGVLGFRVVLVPSGG